MTRLPPSFKPLTNTPNLTDSPLAFEVPSGLKKTIRSAYDVLARIPQKPQNDLPANIVGELTLKLLAVQRSYASGAGHADPLKARRDLWQLQSKLTLHKYAGVQEQAQSFAAFVQQQDVSRIEDLTQRAQDASSHLSTPEKAEIEAIAQHSPSGQAQSIARRLLQTKSAFSSPSTTPRNSADQSWQATPSTSLQASALASPMNQTRVEVREVMSPSPLLATSGLEHHFVAPTTTRKLKVIPEMYSHLSVKQLSLPSHLKVRRLECDHGAVIWMSQTRKMGAFGKFRRGVNQDGMSVGLKELRLDGAEKRGINPKTKKPYTYPTPLEEIAKEVRFIRSFGGQMKLLDMVTLDHKVILVLTDLAGSLEDAVTLIPIKDIKGASRTLVAQAARSVAKMHAAGHMHGDLKLGNIVLDHDGSAVVADFGKGAEVDDEGIAIEMQMGTYPSPLMAAGVAVTPGSDVWALAVMWIMMQNVRYGQWFQYNPSRTYRVDQATVIANFYYSVLDPKTGKIDMSRIDPHDGAFGPMFHHLRAKDAKACELVIAMLNPSDNTRMSSQEAVERWQALLDEDPQMAQQSSEALKRAAYLIGDHKTTQGLKDVRQWDINQQAAKR